jgi:hypothetical protein
MGELDVAALAAEAASGQPVRPHDAAEA